LAKLEAKTEERLGVKYAFMQSWVYEKIKQINRERFGVDFPLQNDEIREKIKTKCMEKYGTLFFMLTEKFKNVMIEKYGDKDFVKTEKFKQIMIERYGVEYALQNKELFDKMIASSFRIKEFTLPKTGRKLQYMGFENDAILYILETNREFQEHQIVTSDTKTFKYTDKKGKSRIYYPDISILDTKIIYEVKSIWTFNLDPQKNYDKFLEVANQGYIMNVIIYEKKGVIYDIWKFTNVEGKIIFTSLKNKNMSIDMCNIPIKNCVDLCENNDIELMIIDKTKECITDVIEYQK
jgi:hypothetical protein